MILTFLQTLLFLLLNQSTTYYQLLHERMNYQHAHTGQGARSIASHVVRDGPER